MKKLSIFLCLTVLAGCASKADDIQPAYVSPVLYQSLSCKHLAQEATSVSSRAAALAGLQNKKAGQDKAAVAVGIVVFWPALFLMQGDGANAAELSRLKGEMDAIEAASRRKSCGIEFKAAS